MHAELEIMLAYIIAHIHKIGIVKLKNTHIIWQFGHDN